MGDFLVDTRATDTESHGTSVETTNGSTHKTDVTSGNESTDTNRDVVISNNADEVATEKADIGVQISFVVKLRGGFTGTIPVGSDPRPSVCPIT